MNIWEIRQQVINEEIDYLLLKSILSDYARPRDKITALLKSKALLRIKKGLYVFGPTYAKALYSKEVLANLIYGPSAISLEYALAFYGIIPEKVENVTSITSKRNKSFNTPIGRFTYQHISANKYAIGMTQVKLDETHYIIIATREKALADKFLLASPGLKLANESALKEYLFDNLRIDEQSITVMRTNMMQKIAICYQNRNVNLLAQYLIKIG